MAAVAMSSRKRSIEEMALEIATDSSPPYYCHSVVKRCRFDAPSPEPEQAVADWNPFFTISANQNHPETSIKTKRRKRIDEDQSIRSPEHEEKKPQQETREVIEKMSHENGILKKAVVIQHERLRQSERGMEQLTLSMQQLIDDGARKDEEIRALKMKNYELSLHLQHALGGGGYHNAPFDPRPIC